MKIICKDNYDRESVSEHFVCQEVNEFYGELIVRLLNRHSGECGESFYSLVKDDYVLYEFQP